MRYGKHIFVLLIFLNVFELVAQEMTLEDTYKYINKVFYDFECFIGDDSDLTSYMVINQFQSFNDTTTIGFIGQYFAFFISFNINDVIIIYDSINNSESHSGGIYFYCSKFDCIKYDKKLIKKVNITASSKVIEKRLFNAFVNFQNLTYQLNQKSTYDPFDNYNLTSNSRSLLVSKNLKYTDQNNNNRIDQNEQALIVFDLTNEGKGIAENVKINIIDKRKVIGLEFQSSYSINVVNPGQSIQVKIPVTANNKLEIAQAEFKMSILLNEVLIDELECTVPTFNSTGSRTIVATTPEVDLNIPRTNKINNNTYALIIGNEDYNSRQPALSKSTNVDFAINDARIFKEYLVKIFGVPEINITYSVNVTSAEMQKSITKLKELTKINSNSNLIVYYAGHGLPLEPTKDQYLVPVDVNSSNLKSGIKIDDLISSLTEYRCNMVTIILDACFSGGARNSGLLANRSVYIKAKDNILKGNVIVISASSDNESASSYKENQHGLFTYFLLEKIQQSKGQVTYGDLYDYVSQNVKEKSILVNDQLQTPTVTVSPDFNDDWRNRLLFGE
jgi:hypothetical protein